MKRLIFSVSALLILSGPSIAQRKPTYIKRTYTKLLTKRDVPARSPVPDSPPLLVQQQAVSKPDSTVRAGSSSAINSPEIKLVSASGAPRTSPEALIQPQHVIRSYYVDLAYNKTVSIIFPTAVRSVDLGSRSIMADKAADVENVLKVKASQIGFNETNFSVMTTDGKFYSFVVNYNETPAVLALNLAGAVNSKPVNHSNQVNLNDHTQSVNGSDDREGTIQFAGVKATQSDIVYASDRILRNRGRGNRGAEANKMEARLRGLYVKENVLYYRLAIENESNLNYDIDFVRYFIVDGKTAKLTSRQEIELQPIYVHNEAITTVRGHQKIERVYAFQRFTIPNNKQLLIMIGEQNGGRELSFQVQNKDIMKARPL
ncbi:conjugative transposon protein TraN [Fibrella arboris]|uniref:conjugative transposon protein TraN n=1 Tax=Fibrella arboris TaxID=3242486 RepID=UPI003521EEA4